MNKFKVGDRVRVYYMTHDRGEMIADYSDVNIREILGDLINFAAGAGWFHYKQCRKLVKKKKIKDWFNYHDSIICLPCTKCTKMMAFIFDDLPKIVSSCEKCSPSLSDEPSTIPDEKLGKLECHAWGVPVTISRLSEEDYIARFGKKVEPKFKVGEWVYLPVRNVIGIVATAGIPGEYGVAIIGDGHKDGKYDIFQEKFIKKINIKIED